MISVWILTAQMIGGFAMAPFNSEATCRDAIAGLSPAIVTEAQCEQIEMMPPHGSRYAPELSPLPPRKPGRAS